MKKIINMLNNPGKNCFDVPVPQQVNTLSSFPEPIDDIERSYYQYRCQMSLADNRFKFRSNLFSFFGILTYLFFFREAKDKEAERHANAVFISPIENLLSVPESVIKEYGQPEIKKPKKRGLQKCDRQFFYKVAKRYPFAFFFLFKTLVKIKTYHEWIAEYAPKAIIVTSEYSFTSSVMTMYCDEKSIEHINVMHGEKLFFIRDSFFRFDKCYIWDEYYKSIFGDLRAETNQFIVEKSSAQKPWAKNGIEQTIDYTYYLQAETMNELILIYRSMIKLKERNSVVAIRPHPLYSDLIEINRIFSDFIIEDNNKTTIVESVLRTKHVVSLYSTVLTQAINNNITIVIDDITDPRKFRQLEELKFICLNKEYEKLSRIILGEQYESDVFGAIHV